MKSCGSTDLNTSWNGMEVEFYGYSEKIIGCSITLKLTEKEEKKFKKDLFLFFFMLKNCTEIAKCGLSSLDK